MSRERLERAMTVEQLDRGRQAFARRQWAAAYASIAAAGTEAPLPPEDLLLMASSATLLGRDDEFDDLLAAAYRGFLDLGRTDRAARCTFWAAMSLFYRGQPARAAGWAVRAQRLVDAGAGEVERAYLQVLEARRAAESGRLHDAAQVAAEALETADRTGERDLAALARLTVGVCDIMRGRTSSGLAVLDEVMVDVTTGGVSAIPSGIVYCTVIDMCTMTMDLPRAREWTTALTRWCDAQPDLVLFRGECLVNRSRLMRLHGSWDDALAEAGRALTRLGDPPGQRATADAWYELGEVLRMQGELDEAEAAYRSADEHGRAPQPGRALLRLAQGRTADAAATIRRALAESVRPPERTTLLPAASEILLAAGDLDGAREAAAELGRSVRPGSGTMLAALADQAAGAVLLAEGRARPALETLHRAWAAWVRLDVPYEVARTRVLLARADAALGDVDGARLELESACHAFDRLGAAPDLTAARSDLRRLTPAAGPAGLTQREVEVLRLVATGRTNRAIAAELFLSEKTVARHLSNIFAKLDVASRAAATAYAFEHGLV